MEANPTPLEISAALAGVRRRARLLAEAEGSWSWSELIGLLLVLAWSGYLIYRGTLDNSTTALFGVALVGGWHYRRLKARVDALTRLLAEIGYPGEA